MNARITPPTLPPEMWEEVFTWLDGASIESANSVCKQWQKQLEHRILPMYAMKYLKAYVGREYPEERNYLEYIDSLDKERKREDLLVLARKCYVLQAHPTFFSPKKMAINKNEWGSFLLLAIVIQAFILIFTNLFTNPQETKVRAFEFNYLAHAGGFIFQLIPWLLGELADIDFNKVDNKLFEDKVMKFTLSGGRT